MSQSGQLFVPQYKFEPVTKLKSGEKQPLIELKKKETNRQNETEIQNNLWNITALQTPLKLGQVQAHVAQDSTLLPCCVTFEARGMVWRKKDCL